MADMSEELQFLGMESNPEVLTEMLHELTASKAYSVHEILGLDEELLAMAPPGVVSVVLLFPSKPIFKTKKAEQKQEYETNPPSLPGLFFLKQGKTLGDACGTIALIHSVANNAEQMGLGPSPLQSFIDKSRDFDHVQRGEALARDVGIHAVHSKFVVQGQTATAEAGGTNHHFIAFSIINGQLVELDGAKGFPVTRGACSSDELLTRAASIIRHEWMDADPDEVNFSVMVVAPSLDD